MSEQVAAQVIALRHEHPRSEPRKLRAYLELHREGLAQTRRKRRRTPRYSEPLAHAAEANQVGCADFKGWLCAATGSIAIR